MTAQRAGHGETPWHCWCHGKMHAVPSLAADCEDRCARTVDGQHRPGTGAEGTAFQR